MRENKNYILLEPVLEAQGRLERLRPTEYGEVSERVRQSTHYIQKAFKLLPGWLRRRLASIDSFGSRCEIFVGSNMSELPFFRKGLKPRGYPANTTDLNVGASCVGKSILLAVEPLRIPTTRFGFTCRRMDIHRLRKHPGSRAFYHECGHAVMEGELSRDFIAAYRRDLRLQRDVLQKGKARTARSKREYFLQKPMLIGRRETYAELFAEAMLERIQLRKVRDFRKTHPFYSLVSWFPNCTKVVNRHLRCKRWQGYQGVFRHRSPPQNYHCS